VALAVAVIVILAGLTAVMLTRDAADLRQSRGVQDRAAVIGALDVAMADGSALAAVESRSLSDEGDAGGVAWRVTGELVGPDEWQLIATATRGNVRRRAEASLVRRNGSGWLVTDWQVHAS